MWKKLSSRGFLEEKIEKKKRFLLKRSEGEKGREQVERSCMEV